MGNQQQILSKAYNVIEAATDPNEDVPFDKSMVEMNDNMRRTIVVQTRILIEDVLKEFQREFVDVHDILQEFKEQKFARNFKRTKNFQGRLDSDGNPIGICKYFEIKEEECAAYVGSTIQENSIRGLKINVKLKVDPKERAFVINKQKFEAYFMEDWSNEEQEGYFIKRKDTQMDYFKGTFINGEIKKGVLRLMEGPTIKMIYQGTFEDNMFSGEGILQIPNKYKYKGNFLAEQKDGFGEEWDFIKQTYYIGLFENGQKDGYGELIYLNRQNLRLKGFWTQGQMKAKQGMHVTKDGQFLATIEEDINLL